MKGFFPRVLGPAVAVLLAGATGCDSSLQEPDEDDVQARLDADTAAMIEVYDGEPDWRQLPYECEGDTDCNDEDPCTKGVCRGRRCAYSHKLVRLTPVYIETAEPALDVSVQGATLIAAIGSGGVEVYDVTEPTSPTHRGSSPTEGDAIAVELWKGGALISEGETCLEYLSMDEALSNRSCRTLNAGYLKGLDSVVNVDYGPRFTFISGFIDGFLVFDSSQSVTEGPIAGFDPPGRIYRVASTLELAVAAAGLGGAEVYGFDLDDGVIGFVATVPTEGRMLDVDIRGDTLVTAEYGKGFSLVDVSDEASPRRLAVIHTDAPATAVRLMGPQTAVLAEEDGRVAIYDVSLNVVDEKKAPTAAEGADGPIHSVSRPRAPEMLDEVTLDGTPTRMEVFEDLIAVALGDGGVALLTTGCAPDIKEDEEDTSAD